MSRHTALFQTKRLQTHAPDVKIVLVGEADRSGELVGFREDLTRGVQRVGGRGGRKLLGRTLVGRLISEPTAALQRDGAVRQPVLNGLERRDRAPDPGQRRSGNCGCTD